MLNSMIITCSDWDFFLDFETRDENIILKFDIFIIFLYRLWNLILYIFSVKNFYFQYSIVNFGIIEVLYAALPPTQVQLC